MNHKKRRGEQLDFLGTLLGTHAEILYKKVDIVDFIRQEFLEDVKYFANPDNINKLVEHEDEDGELFEEYKKKSMHLIGATSVVAKAIMDSNDEELERITDALQFGAIAIADNLGFIQEHEDEEDAYDDEDY